MAYDRYEGRRGWREPGGRFSDDFRNREDERGFFERAGDEVASWFGDDEAERRRNEDARRFDEEGGRRQRSFSSDDEPSRYDRQARFRDEGYRRPYTGRFFGRGGFGSDDRFDRGRSPDRWSEDRWTPERPRGRAIANELRHDERDPAHAGYRAHVCRVHARATLVLPVSEHAAHRNARLHRSTESGKNGH